MDVSSLKVFFKRCNISTNKRALHNSKRGIVSIVLVLFVFVGETLDFAVIKCTLILPSEWIIRKYTTAAYPFSDTSEKPNNCTMLWFRIGIWQQIFILETKCSSEENCFHDLDYVDGNSLSYYKPACQRNCINCFAQNIIGARTPIGSYNFAIVDNTDLFVNVFGMLDV